MKVQPGSKTTISLANGVRFPAIVVGEQEMTPKTIVNRATNAPVEIVVVRADVISLRETREGAKYLALTNEVVQYGYRPIMEPRFNSIVGLDATEDGEKISLQSLVEKHSASYSEWQSAQFALRSTATDVDDL